MYKFILDYNKYKLKINDLKMYKLFFLWYYKNGKFFEVSFRYIYNV